MDPTEEQNIFIQPDGQNFGGGCLVLGFPFFSLSFLQLMLLFRGVRCPDQMFGDEIRKSKLDETGLCFFQGRKELGGTERYCT